MMTKTTSTPFTHVAVSRLEAIRSVALRMFVTEGYQSVSLRQLAVQAGIQAGSLYHHIESKQCLLFDFIEEHEYRLLNCVSKPPLAPLDPRSALGHYLGAYLRCSLARRDEHLLAMREHCCLEPAQQARIQGLRDKQTQILKEIIRSGMARRHFQVDDLDIAVATVRAMLDGAVFGPVGNDCRAEVLIKALQQMVLRSLLSVDAEPHRFYE
jgi:AcrR family transcriptional regulator